MVVMTNCVCMKSTPNDRFFGETFYGNFNRRKNKISFHTFVLMSDVTSNKPTYYLLDYGDFN